MTVRIVCLALTVGAGAALYGCATTMGGGRPGAQTKHATIALFLDSNGVCRTSTTPYVGRASKGRGDKIRWRIVDDVNCTDDSKPVRIDFSPSGKGPNPFVAGCDLTDDKKIECRVFNDASVPERLIRYSVWIGDQQEDPELEIAQ